MDSIKLNNAFSICEELGVRSNIVSNDNNDNPISALIISVNNDRILIANDGNMYYILIRYYKDNVRQTKQYNPLHFTGDNLRSILQLVSGRPIYEVDDAGEFDWFFAGLN
jgi:hypothetical protein